MSDMTTLFVILGIMWFLVLAGMMWLFVRVVSTQKDSRHDQALTTVLQEHASRLEQELAQGHISPQEYASLREDLMQRVVAEVKMGQAPKRHKRSQGVSLGVMVAVMALLVAMPPTIYYFRGAPEVMEFVKDQKVVFGGAQEIEQVQRYLTRNPKEGRMWIRLAHLRVQEGNLGRALDAYREGRKVSAVVAQDSVISLEYATLVLAVERTRLYDEVRALIAEVAQKEAENQRAHELKAIMAMREKRWDRADQALAHLEKILPEGTEGWENVRKERARVAKERQRTK